MIEKDFSRVEGKNRLAKHSEKTSIGKEKSGPINICLNVGFVTPSPGHRGILFKSDPCTLR